MLGRSECVAKRTVEHKLARTVKRLYTRTSSVSVANFFSGKNGSLQLITMENASIRTKESLVISLYSCTVSTHREEKIADIIINVEILLNSRPTPSVR